jgi:uncharacterized protein (TIGR02145 family)
VPSESEWKTLEIYLQNNGYNYDGTIDTDNNISTNNKIAKSLADTINWELSSISGAVGNNDYPSYRNNTGFSALPSGYRIYNGTFQGIGIGGGWWSSTESYTGLAWGRFLNSDLRSTGNISPNQNYGYSVRCIKN